MFTYDGSTSILSISSKKIKDCDQVAETLREIGVFASVTSNTTVFCDDKDSWLEKGCQITFGGLKPELIPERVWPRLKNEHQLNCAYLHVHGRYYGCINEYLRPSKCSQQKYMFHN